MANRQLLLNLMVTASLAVPGIAAGAFQQQQYQSEKLMLAHPLRLPDRLSNAMATSTNEDICEANLLRRQYSSATAESPMWVLCRQTTIFNQIHDFTDCLIANGYKPEVIETVEMRTDAGLLRAQVLETHGKTKSLVMLWFQTGTVSGADRWQWRQQLLTRGMPRLPLCRETEISIHGSGNKQADIDRLTRAAVAAYRSQIE